MKYVFSYFLSRTSSWQFFGIMSADCQCKKYGIHVTVFNLQYEAVNV